MDEKYIEIVKVINECIIDFNEFLKPEYQILLFDLNQIDDFNIFTELKRYSWEDFRFPNDTKKGVYFIVGYDRDNPHLSSMYIGKASLKSIGTRLWDHLNHDRNNPFYTKSDSKGRIHIVEYVFSIDLESRDMVAIAPALEEYLIQNVRSKMYLINKVGNHQVE